MGAPCYNQGDGIRPPTWGFLLTDIWRNKLWLIRQQMLDHLHHPEITIVDAPAGLWIELGPVLAEAAGSTMAGILDSISEVSAIMGGISAAGQEQERSIVQVNSAIADLSPLAMASSEERFGKSSKPSDICVK